MTMRPEDIRNRTFASALRGYDKDEVRSFLHRVAESTQALQDQLTETEAQVAAVTPHSDAEMPPTEGEIQPGAIVDAGMVDVPVESPPGDHFAESSTAAGTDLDAVERAIVDRYGALGDRIAELLRHADRSAEAIMSAAENDSEAMRVTAESDASRVRAEAEQHAAELLAEARAIRTETDAHRDAVMAELDSARGEQETALAEAKAAAEAEIETFRVDSIAEIETLRSEARIEVDELRGGTTAELDELRAAAQSEADQARESAIADGRAAIAEDQAEAARLREEADNDRRTARAELEDVRAEVSGLLEQARTQSEFIKGEADEIIRTKVRANFEQAQARLDVLRNTEIASRERILRAQTELSSALTRLDAEPAPELDPASAPAVIEEAERRAELAESSGFVDVDVDEALESDEPFDTDVVEVGEVGQATFESDVAEANQQIEEEGNQRSPLSAFLEAGGEPDTGGGERGFAAAEYGEPLDVGEATDPAGSESTDAGPADAASSETASSGPIGPSPLAGSLPAEESEVGGPAEEDALARLVREAMQEAVDSAREDD